jgi:hypothetical protein
VTSKANVPQGRWLVTDKLRSYDAAHRAIMPTVNHINDVYANNRAEISHEPTRGFRSSDQAQRFLILHRLTQDLFRLGRHLLQAVNYRFLRTQAYQVWQEVVVHEGSMPQFCKVVSWRPHAVKLTRPASIISTMRARRLHY